MSILRKKSATLIGIIFILVVAIAVSGFFYQKHKTANVYSMPMEEFQEGKSPVFSLPAGNYALQITYSSTEDATMDVSASNACNFSIELPATGGETATIEDGRLILPYLTDKGFLLLTSGADNVTLDSVLILSDHAIYRDQLFLIALTLLIAFVLIFVWIYRAKFFADPEKVLIFSVLFAVLVITNAFIIHGPVKFGIDTRGQLMRINGVATALMDRQIPAVVFPNMNNNYGQIGVLYPHVLLYIPGILRYCGVSLYTAYFFFLFLINALTMVLGYIAFRNLMPTAKLAAASAILYYLMPYRMRLFMDGGSVPGAGTALAFFPLAIAGLICIFQKKGKLTWLMLPVGLWGVFGSHVISTLFLVGILVLTTCMHLNRFDRSVVLDLLKSVVCFFLLSLSAMIPFVDYYFEDWNRGNFILGAYTDANWSMRAITVFDSQYRLISLLLIVLCCVLLILLQEKTFPLKKMSVAFVITSAVAFLLATKFLPWNLINRIPGVESFFNGTIQYGDRFLTICEPLLVFALMILIAEASSQTESDTDTHVQNTMQTVAASVTILSLLLIWGFVVDYIPYRNSGPLLIDSVSGEYAVSVDDYLPNGTQPEWYKTDAGNFSNEDVIRITDHSKIWTHITTSYICPSEGEYLEYPLFYYKDYHAYDQNGNEMRVEKGERNYVRVYLDACEDVHTLYLSFVVKKIYKLGVLISALSFLGLVLYLIYAFRGNIRTFFEADHSQKEQTPD